MVEEKSNKPNDFRRIISIVIINTDNPVVNKLGPLGQLWQPSAETSQKLDICTVRSRCDASSLMSMFSNKVPGARGCAATEMTRASARARTNLIAESMHTMQGFT